MKRIRLRKWVAITLVLVSTLLAILCGVECDSIVREIYIKGASIVVILLNTYLLIKYGDLEDRTDIEILND